MNDYQPIGSKDIERGYFFLVHRPLIKKVLIGLGIFANVIIYAFAIFGLVKFISAGSFDTLATSTSQNYNWSAYHLSRQPRAIKNSPPQFLLLGAGRYNLIAIVENPNEDWAISQLDYNFVINGQELEAQQAFLNPGEKRLLTKMGYLSDKGIGSIDIKIGNIKWQRIENDLPIINFEVKEVKFQPATRETAGENTFDVPAKVTWQARNLSLFNFWEVSWQVVLLASSRIVAVNELKTLDFLSLENRNLEVIWPNDLPRVSTIEVYPILNKLDADNFKDLYIEPKSGDIYKL